MKTAGQILKTARLERKLELEDVARITRIRTQFLALIEADDYGRLSGGTTAHGFIRNYAQFLGLSPDHILAAFRRDFVQNKQGQIVPRALAEPVTGTVFWTPHTTLIATIVMILTVFGGYLGYQYRLLTGPPPLRLVQPVDGLETTAATVVVEGATDPEATISVGGQLVALDKGGQFSFRLPLVPGENTIAVVATSKFGKTTTVSRKVILTTNP